MADTAPLQISNDVLNPGESDSHIIPTFFEVPWKIEESKKHKLLASSTILIGRLAKSADFRVEPTRLLVRKRVIMNGKNAIPGSQEKINKMYPPIEIK